MKKGKKPPKDKKDTKAKPVKKTSGLKRLIRFLVILALIGWGALKLICCFSPDIAFAVNYYTLETKDTCLRLVGMAPHYDNLDLGIPLGGQIDRVFNREGYAFGYNEEWEQPLWVTYKLTDYELPAMPVPRTNDFREDPRVLSRSAFPADYKNSGYDRGHLAPAADMAWSKKTMSESFYMSNMSPQVPDFNRGIWMHLEKLVRDIAKKEHEVFIVSGPIFDKEKAIKTIGANRVGVPQAYYKIIFDLTPPRKMIAFCLPNAGSKKPLKNYAVTVEYVELLTGLTFFPNLDPGEAKTLKTAVRLKDWGL